MKTLESLVPPLELCKQIPKGAFADSALVWIIKAQEEPEVWERDTTNNIPPIWSKYPAPTLAEILKDLAETHDDACCFNATEAGIWYVQVENFEVVEERSERDANPATAALKLWLELNKGE